MFSLAPENLLDQWFSNCSPIRITQKACSCTDGPTPRLSGPESAFPASCRVMLMLRVWGPTQKLCSHINPGSPARPHVGINGKGVHVPTPASLLPRN